MLQHYQYGQHTGPRSGLLPDPSDPRFVSGGGARSTGLSLLSPLDTGGRSGFESELHRALYPSVADRLNQQAGPATGFESLQPTGPHDDYAEYRSRLDERAIGETAERIVRQLRQIEEDIEDSVRERLRELERQERTAADRQHLARQRAAGRDATPLDLEALAQLLNRVRAAEENRKPEEGELETRLSGLNAFADDEQATGKLDTLIRELLAKLERLVSETQTETDFDIEPGNSLSGGTLESAAKSRAQIGSGDISDTEDGDKLAVGRVLEVLDGTMNMRLADGDGRETSAGLNLEELRELMTLLQRAHQILGGEQGDAPSETDLAKAGERVQRLEIERVLELLQRLRDEGRAAGNERVDAEAVVRLRERLERLETRHRQPSTGRAERAGGSEDDEARDPRVRVRDLRSRYEARHRARHDGSGEGRAGSRAERSGSEAGGRPERGEPTAGRASRGGEIARNGLRGELRAELPDGGESGAQRGVARADLAAWGQESTASRATAQQHAEAQLARHLRSELPDQVLRQAQMVIRGENEGEMRLSLYPPELGGVRVRMQVQDNLIAIRFIVENSTVRDVFEQNLHVLQQQLADSGFENAGIEVSVGGNSNGERQENPAGTHNREVEQLDSGVPPLVETYREDTQIDFMV